MVRRTPSSPSGVAAASTEATVAGSRDRSANWPLLMVAGLAALLIGASLLRVLWASDAVGRGADGPDWFMAIVFTVIGSRVVAQVPGNRIAWLMVIIGAMSAVAVFTATYATANVVLAWMSQWTWWLGFALLPLVVMLFPDGYLPSRRWRIAAWTAVAGVVLPAGLLAVAAIGQVDLLNGERMPTGVRQTLVAAFIYAASLTVGSLLAAAAALLLRWRRSRGDERQQLKWFIAGAVVALVGTLMDFVYSLPFALFISAAAVPIAVGIAIAKYRLYDIDPIINRSIVYAGLTAAVVGLYDGLTTLLGNMFESQALPVGLISAGVVAVALQPLRERLQLLVDRLMYGERHDPYVVLSRISQRLETTLDPKDVLASIVETVAQSLKLSYTAIELRDGETFYRAAGTGQLIDEPVQLPLVYLGEIVGLLVAGPRARGEPLSSADQRLLADVARQAAIAAYALRTTTELQRSNERLATIREGERRHFRHSLIDKLSPTLIAAELRLSAIRGALRDPETVAALLDRLRADIQAALATINQLLQEAQPLAADKDPQTYVEQETATSATSNDRNA